MRSTRCWPPEATSARPGCSFPGRGPDERHRRRMPTAAWWRKGRLVLQVCPARRAMGVVGVEVERLVVIPEQLVGAVGVGVGRVAVGVGAGAVGDAVGLPRSGGDPGGVVPAAGVPRPAHALGGELVSDVRCAASAAAATGWTWVSTAGGAAGWCSPRSRRVAPRAAWLSLGGRARTSGERSPLGAFLAWQVKDDPLVSVSSACGCISRGGYRLASSLGGCLLSIGAAVRRCSVF